MAFARHLSKLALSVLVAVIGFITPANAQQEVQIMVSGPWAYVPGPTPTPPLPNPTPTPAIVIAAPQIDHHGDIQIFSGEDADEFNSIPLGTDVITIGHNQPGKYTLIISGLADCDPVPNPAPTPTPQAFPLTVASVDVDNVLQAPSKGFAILIPKPCYYTSFLESRSRLAVEPNSITQDDPPHTTWMVLHYKANCGVTPIASIQELANSSAKFHSNDLLDPAAISIVLGADTQKESNRRCDSLSGQSVRLEAGLFGATLHYQFPRVLKSGEQSHDYKLDCTDNFAFLTQAQLKSVLSDIKTIESFLKNPGRDPAAAQAAFRRLNYIIPLLHPPENIRKELDKVQSRLFPPAARGSSTKNAQAAAEIAPLDQLRSYAIPMTAGAADCRGAQLNVNDTIP